MTWFYMHVIPLAAFNVSSSGFSVSLIGSVLCPFVSLLVPVTPVVCIMAIWMPLKVCVSVSDAISEIPTELVLDWDDLTKIAFEWNASSEIVFNCNVSPEVAFDCDAPFKVEFESDIPPDVAFVCIVSPEAVLDCDVPAKVAFVWDAPPKVVLDLFGSCSAYGGGAPPSYGSAAPPQISSYEGSRSCDIDESTSIKLILCLRRHLWKYIRYTFQSKYYTFVLFFPCNRFRKRTKWTNDIHASWPLISHNSILIQPIQCEDVPVCFAQIIWIQTGSP